MATFSILRCELFGWPPTTEVNVYAERAVHDQPGPPSTTAVSTATVDSDGEITFDDLVDETAYVAYAEVGDPAVVRQIYFRVSPGA